MSELSAKLEQLSDSKRVRLYRDLLERLGEPALQSVQELVLVYESTAAFDPEVLRKTAALNLPEQERPTRYIATARLPRTANGKLDRQGLPGLIRIEPPAPDRASNTEFDSDDVMSSLIATFRQTLGSVAVGPDSNFFELGGHSLLAVECMLALEERTGKRISITQFLNHPTPRGIATLLKEQARQSFDYIYPVSKNSSGLPVFVFSASKLAYALRKCRPDWAIYGIQLRWRDDHDKEIQYRGLEDMAERVVAEIEQLIGSVDFVLLGSSFPGMLAFEVAKQLQAIGRTPKLTVLIDPSLWFNFRTWIELDLLFYGQLREGENHFLRWLVLNNPLRAQFWHRLSRRNPLKKNASTSRVEPLETREVHKAYEAARATDLWQKYTPSQYDGAAVLLSGSEQSWQIQENWQTRLNRDCPMHALETDHLGILTDPFMSETVVPLVTSEIEAQFPDYSSLAT